MNEFDSQNENCDSKMKNIRGDLYSASGRGVRSILLYQASIISDDALGKIPYPDENFSIILEFMSEKELFSKKGAHEFFFTLMNDFYKFTERQRQELFNIISGNFSYYEDPKLYWVICDVVARSYDQPVALSFFREHYPRASAVGRDGIRLGLDIIAYKSKGDPRVASDIDAILKS